MAGNYVEIAIKARDDAKPPLDDLKLALDELSKKVATALAEVDDKEAQAKLLALNARLDAIGRKVENPRITVQGADRAVADMAAVDVALDKVGSSRQPLEDTARDAREATLGFSDLAGAVIASDDAFIAGRSELDNYRGKLSELARMLADVDDGAAQSGHALSLMGSDAEAGAEGAATEAESASKDMGGLSGMMPAVVAAVLALAPAAAGAAAGVSAIGAAGALAYPDIKKVYDVLTGTAKAPSSGPVADAVAELRQFESAWKQISAQSGVGKSLLGDLPVVLDAGDKALHDFIPLARAGATSVREIADAVDKGVSSAGFTNFIDETAKYAPGATQALIGLGGALTGVVGKALEDLEPEAAGSTEAITQLVSELSPELVSALAAAASGMHGLIGGFQDSYEPLKLLLGPLAEVVGGVGHLQEAASAAGHVVGITLGGPLAMLYDAVQKGKAVFDGGASSAKHLGDASKQAGAGVTGMSGDVSATAGRIQAWRKDMDEAAGSAGSLSQRVKALTTALSDEGDATSGALGDIASFHQQLMTTESDMTASADKAGYMTKASLTTASAFSQLYQAAKSASAGILQTTGSAAQAAGPLEAMRAEMEKIQQPTEAERELLHELNAEINALHSKTITIGVHQVDEGGTGQPLPTGGGPTGHPQGGPDAAGAQNVPASAGAAVPGAMTPSLAPAAAPARLEIAPGGSGQFERFMATWIRQYVRVHGGGGPDSVQRAFGRAA